MALSMTSPVPLALSTAAAALVLAAAPALADVALPAPYVSRALDAVLLPTDAQVHTAFELTSDDKGVLVLATEPGGVADAYGIIPGDVLEMVGGQRVSSPIEVDEIVYYWILEGIFDVDFGVWRGGHQVEVVGTITEDSYWEVIEVSTVETWASWEVETSFSYEEYYAEYSEEIVETYEYSETVIEETVTSEKFTTEMSEEITEEEVTEEASGAMTEEKVSDEVTEDEVSEDEEAAAEEEFSEEDLSEEESSEDELAEEEAAEEEKFAEEEASDESVDEPEEEAYDEPAEDEAYDDAGEDVGDEGGDE
jgi:flagellar biosynthesis GTPase FlhF